MVLDISGVFFFMPVFSFLFVFLITYAILVKTKLLGDMNWISVFVSFILAIVFMSFSSIELYVRSIIPWFAVLFVIVFLVLLIAGLSTKNLDKVMTTGFAWVMVSILVVVFLIIAIKVFNPVLHPDLIVTSGDGTQAGIVEQLRNILDTKVAGGLLLAVIAGIVAMVITKGK
ncbi:hypothetical protein HOE04_05450 [archaeon]|jgi:hypothetical protein|nr:hypothetical protein [archaeon]